MDNKSNNPLLCYPEQGICEIPRVGAFGSSQNITSGKKPVKVVYYTDPICSSCWGIEPALRKLQLEYGSSIEIEYRMGGLLPDWSYNSGGISKPTDVAPHWDEVSVHYDMPIDGDVWLEDPLHSSYPPSIAFKAAQIQDEGKAKKFLRRIREMVFLEKKNIAKWEHLSIAAGEMGLDTVQLKQDVEGAAQQLFHDDLAMGRRLGVRGFPTLFFTDGLGNQQMVYGFRPYATLEAAVLHLYPKAIKTPYDTTWTALFAQYPTLATREFAELRGMTKQESEVLLQDLVEQKKLDKLTIKNGVLWMARNEHD